MREDLRAVSTARVREFGNFWESVVSLTFTDGSHSFMTIPGLN